jgi:hypothetical protein
MKIVGSASNDPTTWSPPIIIGAAFAIFAVILGIPGALLATKKLQRRQDSNEGKAPLVLEAGYSR